MVVDFGNVRTSSALARGKKFRDRGHGLSMGTETLDREAQGYEAGRQTDVPHRERKLATEKQDEEYIPKG